MLIIVYDSLTGHIENLASFLSKETKIESFSILDEKLAINNQTKIILLTRSIDLGLVPQSSYDFCKQYYNQIIGISVGGQRNWGIYYGMAGDTLSKEFNIPLISKFEVRGSKKEREFLINYINNKKIDNPLKK